MNEYRCTRPSRYAPTTPGHKYPGAREGYYVVAANELRARREMCRRFPEDAGWFDVQLWQENAQVRKAG